MEPQMTADERGSMERPAPQGEIRDLVLELRTCVGQVSDSDLARRMTVLCNEILCIETRFNEILCIETRFTAAAQTLAGRCYELAGELSALRRRMNEMPAKCAQVEDRKADRASSR